jgi:hypothetical protein
MALLDRPLGRSFFCGDGPAALGRCWERKQSGTGCLAEVTAAPRHQGSRQDWMFCGHVRCLEVVAATPYLVRVG